MKSRESARSKLFEYAVHALLLLALTVPVFPGVYLRGEVAFPGNFLYAYAPWKAHRPSDLKPQNSYLETLRQSNDWYHLTQRAFHDGELPLWNPYQFTGAPLIGAYQTAVFYPPRLAFLVLHDVYVAFTFYMIFKLWLAGMIAYACGRALGLNSNFARFFSIAYMLGGYLVTWCCYPTVDSMAWAPLLFLGIEWLIEGRWRRGFAAGFCAAVCMTLAGGAQHTLTFTVMLSMYFVVRLVLHRRIQHGLRAVGTALATGAAAFGVCAIQVLPFLEALRESVPALESLLQSGAGDYHFTPLDVPVFWTPWYFGTGLHGNYWGRLIPFYMMMAYIGIPCWLGVALALRSSNATCIIRLRVRCLLAVSAIGLWIAFELPGASLVLALPTFDHLRLIYFVTFFVLATPLAAAFALQQWFLDRPPIKRIMPAVVLTVFVLAMTSIHLYQNKTNLAGLNRIIEKKGTLIEQSAGEDLLSLPFAPQRGTLFQFVRRQVLWTGMIFAFSLASLLMVCVNKRLALMGPCAMSGIIALDLLAAWHGLQPTSKREQVFPETPVFRQVMAKGHPFRVSFNFIGVNGLPTIYGIEEVWGYDAMIPKRFWTMVKGDLSFDGWAAIEPAFATPCYFFFAPSEGAPSVPEGFLIDEVRDGVIVASNTRALPRARLVGTVERFDSVESLMRRIEAPGFDPTNLALVENTTPIAFPPPTSAPPGSANIATWRWNSVEVRTEAKQPAVLVLAEAYYPGWEARLDGKEPLEIFPVYHLFRGVCVPEGEHRIEFVYRPLSFRAGATMSVLTLLILLTVAVVILRRRPRKASA